MRKFALILCVLFISSTFISGVADGKPKRFIVIIDPGHGGKDPGNKTETLSEAELNLQIANQILEIKKKNRKNIEFIFTRKGDDFVDLKDRIALIDKYEADLYISIHCDAYSNEDLNGYQIYHPIKGDHIVLSKKYAKMLEEAIVKKKTPIAHKSTKPGDEFVITRAHCPAVLLNVGFLSNPADYETVINPEYQLQYAEAIVESINTYIHKTQPK
jgi:N-acetylmuramoyl-L-alanine amidase